MHRDNWDDLRFVLAVAERGSVSAAARVLGVNHATVLRRIAAFEDRHGGPIFDRTARGYAISPDKARIVEAARGVEAAMLAVGRVIEGTQAPLSGVVRVTSTDTFCHHLLPRILAGLRRDAADLQVDLICSNAHLDLARLDADVTVRPALDLPGELTGQTPARLAFAAYAAHGADERWLGLGGPLERSRPGLWLADHLGGDKVAARADSFVTLRAMAVAGLGRAILPCILGGSEPRLVRLPLPLPDLAVPIWVAAHTDMAEVPRIHAVRSYLADALAGAAPDLEGRA